VQAHAAGGDFERAAPGGGAPGERDGHVVVDRVAIGARQVAVHLHPGEPMVARVDGEAKGERRRVPGRGRAGRRVRWLAPRGGELAPTRRRAALRRGQGQDPRAARAPRR
jgi:hypothetical protein